MGDTGSTDGSLSNLLCALNRIPTLVDKQDVGRLIDLQEATLKRLEDTNKSVVNCNALAQSKLALTSKLFKKTAKQMNQSKQDLDVIYKKLSELRTKIKAERPDLFTYPSNSAANE